jgi:mono/diheme cytochrome c family protein
MKACSRHLMGACLALLLPAATAQDSAQWRQVYSVLSHPRCLNCHTSTGLPTAGR